MSKKNDRFVRAHDEFCYGASLQGYFRASYKDLRALFGVPDGPSRDRKASTRWTIRDTTTGALFTLYDFKETKLYDSSLPSFTAKRPKPCKFWTPKLWPKLSPPVSSIS